VDVHIRRCSLGILRLAPTVILGSGRGLEVSISCRVSSILTGPSPSGHWQDHVPAAVRDGVVPMGASTVR
jgi:hypothetical protein